MRRALLRIEWNQRCYGSAAYRASHCGLARKIRSKLLEGFTSKYWGTNYEKRGIKSCILLKKDCDETKLDFFNYDYGVKHFDQVLVSTRFRYSYINAERLSGLRKQRHFHMFWMSEFESPMMDLDAALPCLRLNVGLFVGNVIIAWEKIHSFRNVQSAHSGFDAWMYFKRILLLKWRFLT